MLLAVRQIRREEVRLIGFASGNDRNGRVLPSQQKQFLEEDITSYLKKNSQNPVVGSIANVSADRIVAWDWQGERNVMRVRLVEEVVSHLLEHHANQNPCKIKVQQYQISKNRITVCGAVHSESQRRLIETTLKRLDWVNEVDTEQVFVMDDVMLETDLSTLANEAYELLRVEDGDGLLRVTETMIRGGRAERDVWCLRSAGHLLKGNLEAATGTLRLTEYGRFRFWIFEHWRNPRLRTLMERMIDQRTMLVVTK